MFQAGHLETFTHTFRDRRVQPHRDRTVQRDNGLTRKQVTSLHDAFSRYGFTGPEPCGEGYVLYGEDGYSLRIRLPDDDDHKFTNDIPVELIVKEIDDRSLHIILDIAISTNMILIDSIGKKVRYVGRDPKPFDLLKWSDAIRIDSIDELRTWFAEEINGWPVDLNPDDPGE